MSALHLLVTVLLFFFIQQGSASCPPVKKCLAALEKGEKCPTLPVPDESFGPALGPEGYSLTKLRSGVYAWNDGVYFSMILFKNRRLVLIDFPNGETSSFRDGEYLLFKAVEEVIGNEKPRRLDMIYGHRHIDHIGGAGVFYSLFRKRFPDLRMFVWGSKETQTFLGRNDMSALPKVNITVPSNGKTIKIARGLTVKLIITGGHTAEDIAALIVRSRDGPGILYHVDIITPGFAQFFNFGLTIDLGRFITAQEEMLKLPFKIFVPGHGRIGDKQDIVTNIEYTRDAIKFIREAADELTEEDLNEAGLPGVSDPTAPQFRNGAFALMVFVDLQSAICTRKLIEKYGCSLGSVDLFALSHCQQAFFYDLVDTE